MSTDSRCSESVDGVLPACGLAGPVVIEMRVEHHHDHHLLHGSCYMLVTKGFVGRELNIPASPQSIVQADVRKVAVLGDPRTHRTHAYSSLTSAD